MDILQLIRDRRSSRALFDPDRKIPEEDLRQILEAARWAPTAHNMQNFEVVVVDDPAVLGALAKIETETSATFVEENQAQLSFSEDELRRKKVGLLASMFPPGWQSRSTLGAPIQRSAALLLVLYDPRKRAPASEGDVLGFMSLGCVMENMWLVAQSLGVGFQIQSVLSSDRVEVEVRRALEIPAVMKIGFAVRLGYPVTPATYLRVRRDIEDFTHRNRYGKRR